MGLLVRNPLLYRHWRIAGRPAKLAGTIIVVMGLLGLALVYLLAQESARLMGQVLDWRGVYRRFAILVLGVQCFIAFYIALGMGLDSISREIRQRTLEFLTTLPIPPAQKVVGLCLGANLLPLLLLGLLTALSLCFGLAGGLCFENLLWLYGLMLAGFAAGSTLGLAGSAALRSRGGGWVLVLILLGLGSLVLSAGRGDSPPPLVLTISPLGLIGPSVDPLPSYALPEAFQPPRHHFFNLPVPWQAAPLAFYVFLAVLGFAMGARKLSRPSAPPLPRMATAAAYAVFHVLLIGFLADTLRMSRADRPTFAGAYLGLFFTFILVWGGFTAPRYAALMQWVERQGHWAGRLLTHSFGDLRTPVLVPAAVLWGMTVGAVMFVNAAYWDMLDPWRLAGVGGVLLLFLLGYLAVFLLGCLLSRRAGGPIGLLLLALVMGVPLAFATIEGVHEVAISATPLGVLRWHVLAGPEARAIYRSEVWPSELPDPILLGLAWSAAILAVFGILCASRLQVLLAASPLGGKGPRENPGSRANEPPPRRGSPEASGRANAE